MNDALNNGLFQVSGFYKFTPIDSPERVKLALDQYLEDTSLLGTVLVAHEGVNGTIAGVVDDVACFFPFLAQQIGVEEVSYNVAKAGFRPFRRMKVKVKKEIVTLGMDGIDPNQNVGIYVKPEDWNQLLGQDDVVLIDTRNDYEYAVGSFAGAMNPQTRSFREFPQYVDQNLDPAKTPKVAMFCTGGIRCEKATAMMLEKGFKEVYHLEGGILEYFHRVSEEESLWSGECFVFDERVTVNQRLEQGNYGMCNACRMPLSDADCASDYYQEGICCPHCFEHISEEKRKRLEQRNLQMRLARERNEPHIGKRHDRHVVTRAITQASTD